MKHRLVVEIETGTAEGFEDYDDVFVNKVFARIHKSVSKAQQLDSDNVRLVCVSVKKEM